MEKPYSQANQPNSACPSTFNGGVTVLPCPFHHNPLSSAAFKVSRTPPAPNTSLCHHLSLTINQINRFINACASNKGSKNGRKPSAEFTSWEKSWNNLRVIFWSCLSCEFHHPHCTNVHWHLAFPKHRKCTQWNPILLWRAYTEALLRETLTLNLTSLHNRILKLLVITRNLACVMLDWGQMRRVQVWELTRPRCLVLGLFTGD